VKSRHASLPRAVCQTLIEARREARLTQTALGRRLGWAQSAVSRIESGDRAVEFVEFVRIAEALGIEPAVLMQRALSHD
jgi:transcriptional regulator with XRE-family HTH domain